MENWVKAEEHWNWASEPEPGQPRDWSSTGTRNVAAAVVADAMLIAAMQTQLKDFNIQKMVDDFVNGIDLSALGKLGE